MRMRAMQSGAEDHWDPTAWDLLATIGAPAACLALLAGLAVRAVLRRGRYRATTVLGEADQAVVHDALRAAERRTVGEIVPVVVARSDAHPAAPWRAAIATTALGSLLLAAWLPWHAPHWLLLCQTGLGLLGGLLARLLPDVARWFVGEARATEVAEEQAFQEFHRLDLPRTAGRTGVLVFVSLFERRVVVLADQGIADRVDAATVWGRAKDAVLDGVRRGSLRDGLVAGIGIVGQVLERHAPFAAGDRNELPDRLIVDPH
jgi:putative membrane protein